MNNTYFTNDDIDNSKGLKTFFSLFKYATQNKKDYIFSFCMLFFSASLTIVSARLLGQFIDKGLAVRDWNRSIYLAVGIITLEATAIGIYFLGRKLLIKTASASILLIRKDLFIHLQNLPLSFYDKQPEGRIVTRITHDVEGIEDFFTNSLGKLLYSIITIFIAFFAMMITNFKLGIFLVLAILPALSLTFLSNSKIRKLNRELSKLNSICNAKLSEFLRGIFVIRSFALESWTYKKYNENVDDHMKATLATNAFYSWNRPLTNFLTDIPLILLLGIGGYKVLSGSISIGLLIVYIRYCEKFSHPIAALTREIHIIQQAFTNIERVTTFLNHKTEDQVFNSTGNIITNEIKGEVELVNLSMGYISDNYVLKNINLKINSGEKIGIVGVTGSGKSTFVSLIARLYEFQLGDILIDGKSIRKYNTTDYRKKIGFVSQNVSIFKGSLKENLTVEESYPIETINNILALTSFDKVMIRNELTLDSEILDGGENLSVGEKQLLSLTRILLKNPSLIILDESTANIDPECEKIIHNSIDRVMKNKTCIFIAHRIDTIKHCDKIFVFRDGHIVEVGNFDTLIGNKDYFYQLYLNAEKNNSKMILDPV